MNSGNNGCYDGNTAYPMYSAGPVWPSHVTHSWSSWGGMGSLGGPDPMVELAKAMNRLAAALEKFNERAGDCA